MVGEGAYRVVVESTQYCNLANSLAFQRDRRLCALGQLPDDLDVLFQTIGRIIDVPDSPGISGQLLSQRTKSYALMRERFDLFRKQGNS
jgi:hypothetical protein